MVSASTSPLLDAPPEPLVAGPRRKSPLERLEHFYRYAKRQAWDIEDLKWNELPPVPRYEDERWRLLWASVMQQQLQADRIAVRAATDLLLRVEEYEAKMYYTTMVADEARHIEGWSRLSHVLGPVDASNPYLDEMADMFFEGETLEEQVMMFQVLFEGTALSAFQEIAEAAQHSVLGEMARRLVRDDGIHHGSGVAYSEHLLAHATPALRKHVGQVLKTYTPLWKAYMTWRPPMRRWLTRLMTERDQKSLRKHQEFLNGAVIRLGIDPPFDI